MDLQVDLADLYVAFALLLAGEHEDEPRVVAERAWRIADAVMAERDRRRG